MSVRNVISAGVATLQQPAMMTADAERESTRHLLRYIWARLGSPLWPGALQHALAVCTWSLAWYSTLGHALNLHMPTVIP